MNNYSYGRLLAGVGALLCASQPAQAFFCFSFALGGNDRDHYRRLPPIAAPARYAPHPSAYLMSSYPLPSTQGPQPAGYPYPAYPASIALPTPAYSPDQGSLPDQKK